MDLSHLTIESSEIRECAETRLKEDIAFFDSIAAHSVFTGEKVSNFDVYENEALKLRCIQELDLVIPDDLVKDFVLIKLQDTPTICIVYTGANELDPYFRPKEIMNSTLNYDNIAGLFNESSSADFKRRLIFVNGFNHQTIIGTIDIESTVKHEEAHYFASLFEKDEYEALEWYLTRFADEVMAYHLADNVFPSLDGFLYAKPSTKFDDIATWPRLSESEIIVLTSLYVSLQHIHFEYINGNCVFPVQILRDFIITKDINTFSEAVKTFETINPLKNINLMCSLISDAFEFISLRKHFTIESVDLKLEIIFNIYKLSSEHAVSDIDQYNLVMILASAVRRAFDNLRKNFQIIDVDNVSEHNHLYHLYNVIALKLASLPKFQEILADNYHTIDSIIPHLRIHNSAEENYYDRNEFERWVMKLYKKAIDMKDKSLEEKISKLINSKDDPYNSNYYEVLADLKQIEV